jgi:hypothetical protein
MGLKRPALLFDLAFPSRVHGQMSRFQMQAIAHDDDAVEGLAEARKVPGDELGGGRLSEFSKTERGRESSLSAAHGLGGLGPG